MKKILLKTATLLMVLQLIGCASVLTSGQNKTKKIDTLPTAQNVIIEEVIVKSYEKQEYEYKKITEGLTPIFIDLKNCSNYRVSLAKDEKIKFFEVNRTINPLILGNLILGGPIGLIADAANSAGCLHFDEYLLDIDSGKVKKIHKEHPNKAFYTEPAK